jgi:hypothetical protein
MDDKELRKRVTQSVTSETRNEIRQAWSKVAVAVLAVFGVALLVLLGTLMQQGLKTQPEPDTEPLPEPISNQELDERAQETARLFVEAKTVAEKAKFVADPRRALPLMRNYYQRHPMEEGAIVLFETIKKMGYLTADNHYRNNRRFLLRHVTLEDRPTETWIFEVVEDDAVRIVWEASVVYSDKEWEPFIQRKETEGGTFRVLLQSMEDDPYFNHDFPPNQREVYHCFRLYHPKSEKSLYGYLRKPSDHHKSFLAVKAMTPLTNLPVTLTIRFPEDAYGEQVFIDQIDSFSWIPGVEM